MHADRALRVSLLGLVLLNLVFVQLTGAASLVWLVPLYALTLASPWLARFQETLVYRALWNVGVLGVFTVLLRHATGDELRYVLEDGMVLAALCQVHLLNNLRAGQRPDLLFLNSLLIAIITGYMCQDLAYPATFLLFVPVFVVALQLQCVGARGAELAPGVVGRVVRDGMRRAGLLLACTMLVFFFWPRDFLRRGFIADEFDFASSGEALEIGFTETLDLRRRGAARASDRVVMTVTRLAGAVDAVPSLWRGATLATSDGDRWWPSHASSKVAGDEPWTLVDGELVRADPDPDPESGSVRVRVRMDGGKPGPLFAPLASERLAFNRGAAGQRVATAHDGTLHIRSVMPSPMEYELTLAASPREPGGPPRESWPNAIEPLTRLPDTDRVRAACDLAEQLARRLPADFAQHKLVERFRDYLRASYDYALPGADGAAESLADFLARGAPGHCEFFASALATMLRSRGVPCRVATGYQSSEWDAEGQTLTIRECNAHAWVEVCDPEAGWYEVDATPASSAQVGPSLWARVQDKARALWGAVSGFDSERRAEALAWVLGQPARAWVWLRTHTRTALLGAFLVVFCAGLLRRLRALRVAPALRIYARALRRSGLRLAPGETPRELLTRARAAGLAEERLQLLEHATRSHEQQRYAA